MLGQMAADPTKDITRPLITFAIRHYNNGSFVVPALRGAFGQTYSPLEILFIDDCSTDDGFAVAQRLAAAYAGPHRIALFRNDRNLGPGGQITRVRELARGEIIVLADADDFSLPHRCGRIAEAFADPEVLAVTCYFDFIDAGGSTIDATSLYLGEQRDRAEAHSLEDMARGDHGTTGAILAIRRRVLEMGTPLTNLIRGEDLVCGFRCALLGRIKTVPEVLVHRRIHHENISGTGQENWSASEIGRWNSRWIGQAVLVPAAMRRDLRWFVGKGFVSPATAAPLFAALAAHSRRLKLLRVARRFPKCRAWMSLCELWRLGVSFKDAIRMLLPVVAPRLEILRKRRRSRPSRSTLGAPH